MAAQIIQAAYASARRQRTPGSAAVDPEAGQ
jgi:hypothetical protein